MKESTKSNIKIVGFFLAIIGISLFIHKKKERTSFREKVEFFHATSEDARGIYTGKTRAVYNPLDQSYKISPWLKENSKNKINPKPFGSWPVISLWIDPQDLDGENRGIIAANNTFKKGRLWERAVMFRYYQNGELRFESMAGLRQHGRGNREVKNKIKNFRLYLRKKYGKEYFLEDLNISLARKAQIKTLAIRKEIGMNFTNDISGYLVNALGGISPRFSHAALFINGEFYSFHHMTQHLSTKAVGEYLGHENFAYAKMYSDKSIRDKTLYDGLRAKIEDEKLDFDSVSKLLDMDSIMSSLLVAMYTGNGDWMQGVYIKDLNKNLWSHISWDYDVAFVPSYHNAKKADRNKPSWTIQSLYLGLDHKKAKRVWYKKIRYLVFKKLIFKDKKFREYFSKLVDKLFLEVIPSKGLEDKFSLYERLAKDSKNKKVQGRFSDLVNFFKYREKNFCEKLWQRVKLRPQSCRE